MKMKAKRSRRATVLLMVVSLLALLFVIVTGFLSLARVERGLLGDVRKTELADAIVEDVTTWAESLIADQLVDDTGRLLGGGNPQSYSNEDISGYRSSNWLAALEPVWDEGTVHDPIRYEGTGSWSVLEFLHWPAVSSLDGSISQPQSFALFELMQDHAFDLQPVFQISDVQWNARTPFGDADGDGVPDSHFLLSGPATQMANAAAGTPVQLPRFVSNVWYDPDSFVPSYIPPEGNPGFRGEKWRRYDEHARYEVAVRVISHGGMVTLDSPTLYAWNGQWVTPFNRDFVVDLFDAVRHPLDRPMEVLYPPGDAENDLFNELHASASAVETSLRRRFLLPGFATDGGRRVPPILAELQGEPGAGVGFPGTFATLPELGGESTNWQRVNLAEAEVVRDGWARNVAFNATRYNRASSPTDPFFSTYDRRHLITTANYSDELMRKQTANDPWPRLGVPLDLDGTGSRGATFRGELKFYLGEIGKAFEEIDINGNLSPGSGRYRFNGERGRVIIEQLARLYYDMLASHSDEPAGANDDWRSLFADPPHPANSQAVSRRQQAFMLAVNTVAFAAPRDTNDAPPTTRGFIDVVRYYDDVNNTPLDRTDDDVYVGYAPQPFFSEVISFTEREDPDNPDDDPGEVNAALAVELYNPNDPYYDFGVVPPYPDVFALRLDQFAISLDNVNPNLENLPGSWQRLSFLPPLPQFLEGRSFLTIVLKNSGGDAERYNQHFDQGNRPTLTLDLVDDRVDPSDPQQPQRVTLNLWRQRAAGGSDALWYHVDKIDVWVRREVTRRWAATYRDASPARYLGMVDLTGDGVINGNPFPNGEDRNGDGFPDTYARWNVVTGLVHRVLNGNGRPNPSPPFGHDTLDNHTWLALEATPQGDVTDPDDVPPPPGVPFSPTAPLITMNAGPYPVGDASQPLYERLSNLPMFGNLADLRPRSFPTVGFMLFVPRFSHVDHQTGAGDNRYWPVSRVLREQWERQAYANAIPGSYPADFGHMPVFDNTQSVVGNTYLDRVGDLPWGLLVFDYFTTLNPLQDANADREPDIDPLRVPGRININTAPWYVLANLPMLGPMADGTGILPIIPPASLTAAFPSPPFWDPAVGGLVGVAVDWLNDPSASNPTYRLLATDPNYAGSIGLSMPYPSAGAASTGRYRLGPWLAQSAAAYRDGVQYVEYNGADPFLVYADSQVRGGINGVYGPGGTLSAVPYRPPIYGDNGAVRGAAEPGQARPEQFGFVTVGELLNVKGFDSSAHYQLPPWTPTGASAATTTLGENPAQNPALFYVGDFVKAVSLLALIDSQYLTTRSNTFTIYTSVMDRENPQASVRAQTTVDRSNLLPRLTYATYDNFGNFDPSWPLRPVLLDVEPQGAPDGVPETPVRTTNEGARPQVIAKQRVGYFNARYDD